MIYKYKDSQVRILDNDFSVVDIFNNKEGKLDCIIGNLDGFHGTFINHSTDKYYLILEGNAELTIGCVKTNVEKGDFVHIPVGMPHSIYGKAQFAVICSPPYDVTKEEVVD